MKKTTVVHIVAGLVALGLLGLGGVQPTAQASTKSAAHPAQARSAASCPLTTLERAPILDIGNRTQIVGWISLVQNGCDGEIFARVFTGSWFTSAESCIIVASRGSCVMTSGFLWFGGHVDSPEMALSTNEGFTASGMIGPSQGDAPMYWGGNWP
jgi:hypothetical protein